MISSRTKRCLCSLFAAQMVFLTVASAQDADEFQRKFDAELANIRALPFGYSVICEQGDIKIRSDKSATFIIRSSLLCAIRQLEIEPERHQYFVLCSADPQIDRDTNSAPVPKCTDLKYSSGDI